MGTAMKKQISQKDSYVETYDSIGSGSLEAGFKKAVKEATNRRLADLEAPHGLFIFAPILMLLMLVYLLLRKPAAKWNSTSSSRSDHSATTEKSSAKYQ